DELGFAEYYEGSDEADEFFGPDAPAEQRFGADLVFIKGNHDDFAFLAEHTSAEATPIPVDAYQRIRYLASGVRFPFARGAHALTRGAFGGIAQDGRPGSQAVSAFYTSGELRRLRGGEHAVDVLLTHEPPFAAAARVHPKYEEAGSPDVAALLGELRPRFH